MLELGIKTLLAYLLGSVLGSLVMGRLRGVDIREQGSGNAGGTNALRTQGWKFALGVVVIDVGKALLAVGVLPGLDLPGIGIDPDVSRDWLAVCCAAAVVFGHVYPVWYEFRGGKGAATLIGAVAVLAPAALLPVVLVWLACVTLTGYVGLGTMLGTVTLPVYFALVAAALRGAGRLRHRHGGLRRLHASLEPRAHARGQREPRAPALAAAPAMTARAEALLARLADGSLHSGAALADQLEVSRAAVWKLVGELRGRGIAVESLPRRGYRLAAPVELLDARRIGSAAEAHGRALPAMRRSPVRDRFDQHLSLRGLPAAARSAASRIRGDPARRAGPARSVLARALRVGADVLRGVDVRRDAVRPAGARTRPRASRSPRHSRASASRRCGSSGPTTSSGADASSAGCCCNCAPSRAGPPVSWPGWASTCCCRSRRASSSRAKVRCRSRISTRRWTGRRPAATTSRPPSSSPCSPHWTNFRAAASALSRPAGRRSTRWRARGCAWRRVTEGVEGEACGADADGALLVAVDGRIQRFHSGDVSLRPVKA